MMDSSADIASTVSTFVDEVNSGRIEAALARFTHDVTIIEDLAPYRWQGRDAGSQWLTAMAANAERLEVTAVVMDLGMAQRIEVEGATGYAIFDGTVLLKAADKTLREAGLLTFALERHSDQWLISALTWTGQRATNE
jgi:ketosteroid isomerase-like protein